MTVPSPAAILRFALPALVFCAWSAGASAQDPRSAAPARELTELLASRKLDSIAARMPGNSEEFIGALTFPGQLMVAWARTTAPAEMNEKLIRKQYREVYIDLNSLSIVDSRNFVTDLGADGLKAKPANKGPADSHDRGTKSMRFDGNWKEDKMSEADYMKAYADADVAYAKAIDALIAELKKPS